MTIPTRQRCFHHAGREAAARCLNCHRFYCRECVAEHAGRLLCKNCLPQNARPGRSGWKIPLVLGRLILVSAGILVTWLVFFLLGKILLLLPSNFHENFSFR